MKRAAVDQLLKRGMQHHMSGQLPQAEKVYREILASQPNQPDALHLLGMVENQKGKSEVAIGLIERAILLAPERADFRSNLGLVHASRGDHDKAIESYQSAISLRADYPQALNNLGNSLRHVGRIEEAIAMLKRAIALRADYFEAHNNLGNTLVAAGDSAGAIAAFRAALSFHATAEIYTNLGIALAEDRQLDEAVLAFREALRLRPEHRVALLGLAGALHGRDDLEPAIEIYRHLLAGDVAQRDEIEVGLGNALKNVGRLEEAIAAYRRAMEINPANVVAGSNLLFTIWYSADYDAAAILEEHRRWDRRFAEPLRELIPSHENDCDPDRRLRIGYVSPDFRQHATAFSTVPLLRNHDHKNFEIFCYSSARRPDAITDMLRGHADVWVNAVKLSNDGLAERIRADGIDILVDLSMHSSDGRPLLFARKPATVQVAFIAQPGSTGMKAVDYRLTDAWLDPPGETDGFYVEKSIRLPHSFWCFEPLAEPIFPNGLPAAQNGFVTFGCLNNYCKVNGGGLALWSKVLAAIPDSRLLIRCPAGSAQREVVRALNVDARRIEFVGKQARQVHLQTYHRIDISLDTFPYNGHMTSLESLWMGVPVVNLVGGTVMGRAGVSQLMNLGMPEWITRSEGEFVRVAAGWASDLQRLAELRATLRGMMEKSALMDGRQFARDVEGVYRQMWRRYCGG